MKNMVLSQEKNTIIYPPRVVSGVQPATEIHLGHYFGALKQHIELHHEYPGQTFVLIADYHSLNRHNAEQIRNGTLEMATTYLALGLDPEKAVLYRQSDIPEVTELAWILSCQIPAGNLNPKGMTDIEVRENLGHFVYPVLMAADILTLMGTVVPRAVDQGSNIDLTREVALAFNKNYEEDFFPLPENRVNQLGSFVPGTDGRKMHVDHNNTIGLFERFDKLRAKVSNMKTFQGAPAGPKGSDSDPVFKLLSLVAHDKIAAWEKKGPRDKPGSEEAKRELLAALKDYFGPYEEKYHQLKEDPGYVRDLLRENAKKIRGIARDTINDVRKLV
ncbi:MAG TPA: tryptophan--tRNA ligase, partial [bacterium]|nr:tryptophan--tRNA ligase [bacterium]